MKDKRFSKESHQGFTLIELMVVVAIFAFMSAVVLANYPQFNAQIILENTAHEIALEVRQAQSFGLGVRESISTSDEFPGYGVFIDEIDNPSDPLASSRVILYADVDGDTLYEGGTCVPGNGECVEMLTLRNHSIVALCADLKTDNPDQEPFRSTSEVAPYISSGYCDKDSIDVAFVRPDPDAHIKTYIDGGAEFSGMGNNDVSIVVATPQGDVRTVVVWATGQITVE
jgi:prepilin-type N-terminal cleavage/methylation domain-containing protein